MTVDRETGMREADVDISGTRLTFAQSLSLRVAVSSFRLQLDDPQFRRGIGEILARNYDVHLARVEQLLIESAR